MSPQTERASVILSTDGGKAVFALTDDHFDRAALAPQARETGRTAKPVNAKEPRNALCFRGSLSGFASVRTGIDGR